MSLANHPVIQEVKEKVDAVFELKEEIRDEVKNSSDALFKKIEALITSQAGSKNQGTHRPTNKAAVKTSTNSTPNRVVMTSVNSLSRSEQARPCDLPQVDPRSWRKKAPSLRHGPVN